MKHTCSCISAFHSFTISSTVLFLRVGASSGDDYESDSIKPVDGGATFCCAAVVIGCVVAVLGAPVVAAPLVADVLGWAAPKLGTAPNIFAAGADALAPACVGIVNPVPGGCCIMVNSTMKGVITLHHDEEDIYLGMTE